MMISKKINHFYFFLILTCTGCAGSSAINVSNESIHNLKEHPLGTYSDYGRDIVYDEEIRLHRFNIYVGGFGGCDQGAVLYAKKKLDEFMKSNNYSSYNVIKGEYSLFPLSKCELFVHFE